MLLSGWNTETKTLVPVRLAAEATMSIAFCSPDTGRVRPGVQVEVILTARKACERQEVELGLRRDDRRLAHDVFGSADE